MSNMKDILGDMTLEEFEVERKTVLEIYKEADDDKIVDLCCGQDNRLYDIWLEIHGKTLANEWVFTNGGYLEVEHTIHLMRYLRECFIEWLNENVIVY